MPGAIPARHLVIEIADFHNKIGPSTTVCPAQRYIRSWAKRTLCRHRRSVEIDPTRTCTSNEGRSRSILRQHDIKVPLRPYLTKREPPHDCANQ